MKTRPVVVIVLSLVLLIAIAPPTTAHVLELPATFQSSSLNELTAPTGAAGSSATSGSSPSVVPCVSPGTTVFYEGFDSVAAPGLPAGWSTSPVSGTQGAWRTNSATVHPPGEAAYSAPNFVYFNSWTASAGQTARLYRTTPLNLQRYKVVYICFCLYRDPGFSGSDDFLQVQVSTNGGSSWTNVGTPFTRYSTTPNWWRMGTSMTDQAAGRPSVNIGFLGTSEWGNDIHVDDVLVVVIPAVYLPLMIR
jgi:hypothetical protein